MVSSRSFRAVLLCLAASQLSAAADDRLAGLTKAVTAFKLANGAQFMVVERPYSPLVAFQLRIKAGVADEPSGRGGLASLALLSFLEGSETYGTRNASAEKAALGKAEALLDLVRAEQAKGDQADEIQKGRAEYQAQAAFNAASQFAIKRRYFEQVLGAQGASGFQVHPSADASDLSIVLPSNLTELWFRMTASWLQAPSARFFLADREMVLEQRERAAKAGRMLRERAFAAPFLLHPYQAMTASETEISGASPADLLAFMKSHYVPANLLIAIVGDVSVADARRMAETYFGPLPAATPAAARDAIPIKAANSIPVQIGVPESAVFAAGWPRPSSADVKTDSVFSMLEAILAGGAGSRLQSEMLSGVKVANRVAINPRFPGGRYSNLFIIEAEPLPSQSHADVENAIGKVLLDASQNGFTDEELVRARSWWRTRLMTDAETAAGRALQLVRLQSEEGTYKVEDVLARLDAVTAAECQQVLTEYLAAQPYFSVLQFTAVAGSGE